MYLSRMPMNPARRGTARLLASPQMMHAAVLASFPPGAVLEDAERGRVLWRVDRTGPHAHLYVVSPEKPDFTALVEQAGWPLASTWETKEYDPFLDRIHLGDEYRFSLVANPVRDVRQESGRSKRLPHVRPEHQVEWLELKGGRAGFELVEVRLEGPIAEEAAEGRPSQQIMVSDRRDRRFRRGEGTVTLRTARFDGVLRVTDAEAFRRALGHGIGPAKGYGCGLMTISRPRAFNSAG